MLSTSQRKQLLIMTAQKLLDTITQYVWEGRLPTCLNQKMLLSGLENHLKNTDYQAIESFLYSQLVPGLAMQYCQYQTHEVLPEKLREIYDSYIEQILSPADN